MNRAIGFQQPAIERIVDGVDTNNFGVLFHSTKTIEAFQVRSGMEGGYTTEYQHHYIALIARLEADDQRLDMAIPMCMFNYHQEVGGASVEFNMGEVGEANGEAMTKALEKFNEFETTDMYKSLVAMGFTDFKLEGLHSIHAHPANVNRFSGTDLRADIKHPGVNFPLSVGENVANFASIIQHKEGHAQIIHTEYRLFNGVENGERNYKKGRTLTIVKGFDVPEPEPWIEPEPGIIDQLFGTKRQAPPKPKPEKVRPDYTLRDGFAGAEETKLKTLEEELMTVWKECAFEIDVSLVLKTNVLKGRGRLLAPGKQNTWGGGTHGSKRQGKHNVEEINAGLFGTWERTGGNTVVTYPEKREYLLKNGYTLQDLTAMQIQDIVETYDQVLLEENEAKFEKEMQNKEPEIWEMKAYLVEENAFSWMELNQLEDEEIKNLYWMERLDNFEDEQAGIIDEVEEPTDEEQILFLLDIGFTVQEVSTWDENELHATYQANIGSDSQIDSNSKIAEYKMKEYLMEIGFTENRVEMMDKDVLKDTYELNMNKAGATEKDDGDFSRAEMENMLIADNIIADVRLKNMSIAEVQKAFHESYGI